MLEERGGLCRGLDGTNRSWRLEFSKGRPLRNGLRSSLRLQSTVLYLSLHGVQQPSSRNNLCHSERRSLGTNSSNMRRTSSQNPITVPIFVTFLLRISADTVSNLLCLVSADPMYSVADRFLPHTTSFMGCMGTEGGHGREISTGRMRDAIINLVTPYLYHSYK